MISNYLPFKKTGRSGDFLARLFPSPLEPSCPRGVITHQERSTRGHIFQGALGTKNTFLVVSNHYPSYSDLYRYGFLHKRVLQYKQAGLDVDVIRLNERLEPSTFNFEGVDVVSCHRRQFKERLHRFRYTSILVHFLDPLMWSLLKDRLGKCRMIVWLHGAEVRPWWRRNYGFKDEKQKQKSIAKSRQRLLFWKEVLSTNNPNLHFVFVSRHFAEEVMVDVGVALSPEQYSIIHNVIDTDLFRYEPKPPQQRARILSIRPFSCARYANDLTVKAILELSKHPCFGKLEFRLVGDGPLYTETVEPLRKFENVVLENRFLRHHEIAALHLKYGVFLIPTRLDSQGVSRDEAMASGLVPISNSVAAVPEFVDRSCGFLAEPEDYQGLAESIIRLYNDPSLFSQLSANAAARVRAQSAPDRTILREIALIQTPHLTFRALHAIQLRWWKLLGHLGKAFRKRTLTITVVAKIHRNEDAVAAVTWFQQFGATLPGKRLLLVASHSMPSLEVAQLYRTFNRFGVTVTAESYAIRDASHKGYRPIETTHVLAVHPSSPPSSEWLTNALSHLQSMPDVAIAQAGEQKRRFQFGSAPPGLTYLCTRSAFSAWLGHSEYTCNVYFL